MVRADARRHRHGPLLAWRPDEVPDGLFLDQISTVVTVQTGRDHVVVHFLRQSVRALRVQKSVHPFSQGVQLQHATTSPFCSLSILYAKSPSFASCVLYKLTKVICLFSTISLNCTYLRCVCTPHADSSSHASCMVSAEKRNSPYSE